MKYECKQCDYVTENKANYVKHENTKKHINNIKKISKKEIRCLFCQILFVDNTDLKSHTETCHMNPKNIPDKVNLVEVLSLMEKNNKNIMDTMMNMQKQIIELSKEKEKNLKDENKYLKSTINEAGTIVKKSLDALKYADDNFKNAPV